MGMFSRLFGETAAIERRLEATYTALFQATEDMSRFGARRAVRGFLKLVKKECRPSRAVPDNFGDVLLAVESKDEEVRRRLDAKREEGVRDEDIRWWWNMHWLESGMLCKMQDYHKLRVFIKLTKYDGLSREQAMSRVRKTFPMYGDPSNTAHTSGDDRPLPSELMQRIDLYIEHRTSTDRERFKTDVEECSSFNAFIRREIGKGTL